ncbi:MAG: glycosyltransferase [Sphingobacteriaceae bacterium]|nr:glycosyltransferase [Sphingobacteriaceae bacterium]
MPNYLSAYFFLIKFVSKWRFITGIKTAITVVDCRIPSLYNSTDQHHIYSSSTSHTYKPLLSEVKLNGIFTWYKSFKDFVKKNKLVSDFTKIYPVTSRYVTYSGDIIPFSEKKNQIIFAGRLDDQKRPMTLLRAIKSALEKDSKLLIGWEFKIYGKGILENEIKNFIEDNNLRKHVELTFSPDMKQVLRNSKCLVSTQEFENFPSMSIYEAMVTGNAIIAFNVGQTSEFIKDGENGIIVKEQTEDALSDSILNYVSKSELQEKYYKNNMKLCSQNHTYLNFRKQIEEFWDSL